NILQVDYWYVQFDQTKHILQSWLLVQPVQPTFNIQDLTYLITGIYIIALQIYTLSEDRLLSQSIGSDRDAIQLCHIQYMSHHGRSVRPIIGT
ncbi:hypothetical protein GIB67_031197, partial [Kingdonia uniflora]